MGWDVWVGERCRQALSAGLAPSSAGEMSHGCCFPWRGVGGVVLGKLSPSRQTASAHGPPTGLLLLPLLLSSAHPHCSAMGSPCFNARLVLPQRQPKTTGATVNSYRGSVGTDSFSECLRGAGARVKHWSMAGWKTL